MVKVRIHRFRRFVELLRPRLLGSVYGVSALVAYRIVSERVRLGQVVYVAASVAANGESSAERAVVRVDRADVLVLPAYAGMIPDASAMPSRPDSAPRIRGDDPSKLSGNIVLSACSPHTRG